MKLRSIKQCLLAVLMSAGATGAVLNAAPITVPDPSFEGSNVADGGTTGAPFVGTNWTASGNGGVFLRNPQDDRFAGTTGSPGTLPSPADGTNYFNINLGAPGYGWQDIGPLEPSTIYTLTVAVGQDLISGGGSGRIALVDGVSPFGTILASTPVDSSFLTPGTFADSTLVFTNGQHAGAHLTILLQGDSGSQLIFDNVRLDGTPAPQAPTAFIPTASPSNSVYMGTIVTLSEDPAGEAPFYYQWQSDGGTFGSTFTNVPGATDTNLVVDTAGFPFSGYSEMYQVIVSNSFGVSTSAPVTVTAIDSQPILVRDTLPASGSDVVGGEVTFSAVFDGTQPITYQWKRLDTNAAPLPDLSWATNSTLTLTNLQLSDYAIYYLEASNAFGGPIQSTPVVFTVNPVPAATNNLVVSLANQIGLGGNTRFTPSWTIASNSLLAGVAPSSVGPGNFSLDSSGDVAVLTDEQYGTLFPAGNGSLDFVTCGNLNGPAGQSVTYALPASATGYDLTNIVVYGGWSDAGRDEQNYGVYYSTVASPTNFNLIKTVIYNPENGSSVQSATRATITPATAEPIARNVAALRFDFNTLSPGVENSYAGYCEIGAFGVESAPAPVLAQDIRPVTGSDVEGSEVTFTAAFTSDTPVTYQWRVDTGGGPVNIAGATNTTLTLTNLQLADTGSYSLQASNVAGAVVSSSSSFTVNPAPAPDGNGMVISPANQTGSGATFTPTWTVAAGSLIAGFSPSSVGGGNFTLEGCGGLSVLTDVAYGSVGSAINTTLASCGPNAGTSVTYTLTGSTSGYDLTNIVIHGGWSDGGRDAQAYTVSYSTVLAPTTFIPVATVNYNPTLPGSVPSADRVTLTSTLGTLATNVSRVKIEFADGENGWSGYSEASLFGAASAPLPLAPFVTADILPVTGSDVVGSDVTFTASFDGTSPIYYQWQVDTGSGPVAIPDATNSTLTLTNLQLTDTAAPGYSLLASNSLGTAVSGAGAFTVNPVPAPNGNGIIVSPANQTANGAFTPTWMIESGSLIAATAPSSVGSGSFVNEGGGGVTVLSDGVFGSVGGGNATLATCGSGAGTSVTYTLAGSSAGYDLAKIVTYGGWADGGRDEQHYTVSYATASDPGTFITLSSASYNPTLPGSVPSADRVTLTRTNAVPLATAVSALRFDFTTPAGENGWSGYTEIGVFGVASASTTPPTIDPPIVEGGNLILTGTGGTPGGPYTWLTSTNVAAPLATWTTNSTGTFDGGGAFSNAVPISLSEPERFFRIRIP